MPPWYQIRWEELFVPSQPILETMIRGTCTYLALFLLLRFFRRQTGSLGAADLLVLILIADAAQNAMAGDYNSITDGMILIGTIVFWEYAIDWLGYHVPSLGRWIDREPLLVVEDGEILEENLRQELMTREDLFSQIRQKGVEEISGIKRSYIEGDGHISVIATPPVSSLQGTPHSSQTG